jgi:hypothetical protein
MSRAIFHSSARAATGFDPAVTFQIATTVVLDFII